MGRTTYAAALAVLTIALAGCATLWPDPQTPAEAVGACYATVTGLANGVSDGLEAERITPEQGEESLAVLNNAKAVCDTAGAAFAGGRPEDGADYLEVAAVLLDKLEAVLANQKLE